MAAPHQQRADAFHGWKAPEGEAAAGGDGFYGEKPCRDSHCKHNSGHSRV